MLIISEKGADLKWKQYWHLGNAFVCCEVQLMLGWTCSMVSNEDVHCWKVRSRFECPEMEQDTSASRSSMLSPKTPHQDWWSSNHTYRIS